MYVYELNAREQLRGKKHQKFRTFSKKVGGKTGQQTMSSTLTIAGERKYIVFYVQVNQPNHDYTAGESECKVTAKIWSLDWPKRFVLLSSKWGREQAS